MNTLKSLNWRYAVKKMNGNQVAEDKVENILEAIRLSATGFGLQPFQVLVIKDAATKEKLSPACYNQPQIKGSSHLLVFAIWNEVSDAKIEEYMQLIVKTRGVARENLDEFFNGIKNSVGTRSIEQQQAWSAKQAYLAMGSALIAAAEQEVDSTPMEGFNPAGVDEVLGLEAKGLKSVLILAVGEKDSAGDYLYGAKKVRKSKEELFIRL